MSIGQVKDVNCPWRFQDVINACVLYEQEEKQRQQKVEISSKYPRCSQTCKLVSSGLIFVCVDHGNLHICTRDTCEYIIDKKDEHKQVCILTGIEYIREFDMVFGYDEADEDAVDTGDLHFLACMEHDSEDERNAKRYNECTKARRDKRKRKLDRYDAAPTESIDDQKNLPDSSLSSFLANRNPKPIEKEDNLSAVTDKDFKTHKKRRKRKNKNLCDMTELEKKSEISNNGFFIESSIKDLGVDPIYSKMLYSFIMDTWIIANKKEVQHIKNKSTFYNLFMHISVSFKCVQDGTSGIIKKIDNLYACKEIGKQLTAAEICSKLSVNGKYYTHCCSIFRQIMKFAIDSNLLKDYGHLI